MDWADIVCLADLKTGCAVSCGASDAEAERLVCNIACERGVAYLQAHRPRGDRQRRRMHETVAQAVKEQTVGFGIIISSIIGWLIQKAMEWIWNWWTEAPKAAEYLTTMCAGVPAWCES